MSLSREKNVARLTAALFRTLGQPARLRILQAIGPGEACVCHLEEMLGLRQAYISQHLMALRDQGLVTTRREGKFVYYRLQDPDLLDLTSKAAQLAGAKYPLESQVNRKADCSCPSCATQSEALIQLDLPAA